MRDISDEKLVFEYLRGNEKSLEDLIKKYLKPIFGFIYKRVGDYQATEDITQEVFVRAWKNIKKFKKEKNFRAWIFSIAKNASIDYLRKKKSIPFSRFEPGFVEKIAGGRKDIGANVSFNLFLEKLLPKYRDIISLCYSREFSFQEIADFLKEPLNTVKSRHRRAIIMLRKIYKD